MKKLFLLFACTFLLKLAMAQPEQIKTFQFGTMQPREYVNGTLFFVLENNLWKTDGTGSSTINLTSFTYPDPRRIYASTSLNGILYFTVQESKTSYYANALWKSDGTVAGTVLIKSYPVATSNIVNMTVWNGYLYFSIGSKLLRTDGTSAGTVEIEYPDATDNINKLTGWNGSLYFNNGSRLLKTNGTSAGTVEVKNLDSSGTREISDFWYLNNTLFIVSENQLWKSDGTGPGTSNIRNFNSISWQIGKNSNYIMFVSDDSIHGKEPWSVDEDGNTQLLMDIRPGSEGSNILGSVNEYNELVYFKDNGQSKLYRTDGTPSGTLLIYNYAITGMKGWHGTMYFLSGGLWKTDGTPSGTVQIVDTHEGTFNLVASEAGPLMFSGTMNKLWLSEGTEASTVMVAAFPDITIPDGQYMAQYSVITSPMFAADSSYYFEVDTEKMESYENSHTFRVLYKYNLSSPRVSPFTLVNSLTGTDIRPLKTTDTISVDDFINIRSNVLFSMDSVVFYLNNVKYRTEHVAPYTIAESEWHIQPGAYTIKSIAYNNNYSYPSSMLLYVKPNNSPVDFTLVNAITDTDIQTLADNDTINLVSIGTSKLNVRASSSMSGTKSIVFDFDGVTKFRTENVAPYSLFGDENGDYNAWNATLGTHTLTATAYTGPNGGSSAGTPKTIHFTIVNPGARYQSIETFPNPVEDQLSIHTDMDISQAQIVITDIHGREYYSGTSSNIAGLLNANLSGAGMSSGVYVVKIITPMNTSVTRIFKK